VTNARSLTALVRDPVAFSLGVFDHDHWGMQKAILRSVKDNAWTSVKACHASGKTFTAGDAALWWVTAFDDGIVVTTAPTWTQVEKLLWGNIHKALNHSKIKYPTPLKTELVLKTGENYAIGISTNEGVRFQGWHGRILIILDEAPGVLPEIYEAIEGIRSGGQVHVLELGNPILSGGPFFDSFGVNRRFRTCFTISAFDTPNFAGVYLDDTHLVDDPKNALRLGDPSGVNLLLMSDAPNGPLDQNVRPYLITRRWVYEKYFQWGPTNPLFQSKVLGNFPDQGENALISMSWVERARLKHPGHDDVGYDVGIDVAGPGEAETVVYIRQGWNIVAVKAFSQPDPRAQVYAMLRPYKGRINNINVDAVGQGHYFALGLQDQGFPVTAVNVGATPYRVPRNPNKLRPGEYVFANLKADLAWNLREQFYANQIGGLTDEMTGGQCTVVTWEPDQKGRITIESKDDLRDRGVASPDRFEALMLCFAPARPRRKASRLRPSISAVTLG
jgi:phage terminase large subunit